MKTIGLFRDKQDGSLKRVFESEDKRIVEMTLLFNRENKDVVCVPTHHFCNLGCKMCHLTNSNVKRPMIKILGSDFIKCLMETLTIEGIRITDKKNLLISFMGVGEPLLNLELIEYVKAHEYYLKEVLGYEHIGYAISTMMPNDNVSKLADIVNRESIPLKVHFSMHTPDDEKRFKLIPSTCVSVREALDYLSYYRSVILSNDELMSEYIHNHRTNDVVEIHYTLIDGVNDSDEELRMLVELLKQYKITIKFIRFNPINGMIPSRKEEMWINTLITEIPDLRVKVYSPPGREIGSSCGEFTKHYYHEEIETEEERLEFLKWKSEHEVKDVNNIKKLTIKNKEINV